MDPIFRQTHLLLNQVNLGYILACSEVYQKGMLFLFGEQHIFFSGRLLIFVFWARFWIFFGFLVLCFHCFSAFLLLCCSAFCFSCLSAFLLFCSLLSLLLCFSASLCFPCASAFLRLCFCAFLPLLYYSTFFFESCVFASLPTSCSSASLLPVLTVSLFFIFFSFILSCLYPK